MEIQKKVDNEIFLDYLDAFVSVTSQTVSICGFDHAKECVLISRHDQVVRVGLLSLLSLRSAEGREEDACTFALETASSEAVKRYGVLVEKLVAQIPLHLWVKLIPLCIDDDAVIHSSECEPGMFRWLTVSLKDISADVTTESYTIYYDLRSRHYVLEIMFHPFANRSCPFSIALSPDKADAFYAAVLNETVHRAAEAARQASELAEYVTSEWQRVVLFDEYTPRA